MKPQHGLVIGKFYPPHEGHHLLVRTAASVCERVTVVVMAATVESISLSERVAWMREVHRVQPNVAITGVYDNYPVDLEDDGIWRAHVSLMQKGINEVTPKSVDAVFTSESYGPELARRFNARHVFVDPERWLVPMSGTLARRDLIAAWAFLSAPVRRSLAKRVVLVGAESTGKTTLVAEITQALRSRGGVFGNTICVAEYGREYSIDLFARERAIAQWEGRPSPTFADLRWTSQDFEHIAVEQNRREDLAAGAGGPILLCDTDAFTTGIWHERFVGAVSTVVEGYARQHSLYLLTHPSDVPFVQDGLREASVREWMTQRFAEALEATGRSWQWLRGADRCGTALSAVDGLLSQGWSFEEPLG